jgi:DNA-binding transcriptional LysR family regulator
LIPSLALSPGLRYDIAIRDLYPDVPSRRVVAASRRGASALPAAAAMLDILREQAGSLPPLVG